ncbi:conserved hypothetical protein [Echinococcus multilocularis]|uniref:Uncharacterized protein n=1 Tax=Echinococcus multilocularis TaxID=6211 RepID=A0A068XYN9_ECHMU|nr:conserved hypothetical protein [Echinococcus multilocularis]
MQALTCLGLPLRLVIILAALGVITCTPWGLRDYEAEGRSDLDPLWLTRLLERQEPYDADLLTPIELSDFGTSRKRSYARPAIRMG